MKINKLSSDIWAYTDLEIDGLLEELINSSGDWISYNDNHNVVGDCIYIFPEENNSNVYQKVLSVYNKCLTDYVSEHSLEIPLENLDIATVEPKINNKYMGYDQPASILFRKYKPGTVMPFHEDSIHREYGGGFTALFYLNDDYEGGELFFKNKNITFKPTKGSLIIFPGNEIHEILLLKSGLRYMISAYFFKDKRPDALTVSQQGFGSDGFAYWLAPETLPVNYGNIKHEVIENNYIKPQERGIVK